MFQKLRKYLEMTYSGIYFVLYCACFADAEDLLTFLLNFDTQTLSKCDAMEVNNDTVINYLLKRRSGVKQNKTRLMYAFTVNADGSDPLEPFVIGCAAKPVAFKRKLPVRLGYYYRLNKKAWMTGELYEDYIWAVINQYEGGNKETMYDVDVRQAMLMANNAWREVKASMFVNCFRKAGILSPCGVDGITQASAPAEPAGQDIELNHAVQCLNDNNEPLSTPT
ncbi:hypothetical protein JCM10212_007166 [Sporobolomyces blumeae]